MPTKFGKNSKSGSTRKPLILHDCLSCRKEIPVRGRMPSVYNRLKYCDEKCRHASSVGQPLSYKALKQRQYRLLAANKEKPLSQSIKDWLYTTWPRCDYPPCISTRLRFYFLRQQVTDRARARDKSAFEKLLSAVR